MGGEHGGSARLLLVEDDDGIARPLAAALDHGGYAVVRAATGADALAAARSDAAGGAHPGDLRRARAAPFDLVILDLGLPDVDGVELCRGLRRDLGADVPVLMLTARTSEAEVVVGLDAGADDYVTKPFRLAELQARVRALLRRGGPAAADGVAAQDIRVDLAGRRVLHGDDELDLTPTEFDLLALLVRDAGAVVSRDDIMAEVWGGPWYGSTKTLDVHVSALRRKLGDDPAAPRYLTTVRGVGLRFETASDAERGAPARAPPRSDVGPAAT